jgi:cellulose synthase/poly-beta-1,6-N-acetylglucosamine synthase-like glycosyltransferase
MKDKVSIVIPTKNNGDIIEKCLKSIQNLDYPKDKLEVIIVDGYSTDNTVEIAKKYGCKIIFENKGTISYARDVGVKHAKGDFIAFTDADCVVDRNWIKELIKHFNDEKVAGVGGPNITPEDDTEFAKCVGLVLSLLSRVGARYGLVGGDVVEIYHNPTCNVMYRKDVLEEVGGFNYSLVTVDDEELDYRIRKKGYRILYTPHAIVYHYRKPTWKKFMKMAWNYGVGRMQAIKLHRDMGRWFHFVPSLLIAIVVVLLLLSNFDIAYLLVALGILVLGGIGIALLSALLTIKHKRRIRDFVTIYLLIAIWFWGWGLGFMRGIFKPVERSRGD